MQGTDEWATKHQVRLICFRGQVLDGRAASDGYLTWRCRLWRHIDDNIPVILIHVLIISCAMRVVTWRRLQLHPAAQLQHQAHWQAQQEDYEGGQEQQLQSISTQLRWTTVQRDRII